MVNFNLHSLRLTFLLYFFSEIFWSFTRAACYYPNGRDMAEMILDYSPCNNGDEHSMCCAAGQDTCRIDGLCYYNGEVKGSKGVFRDGCTDPTWESPSCVKLCLDGTLSNRTTIVTPCDNGSYCCGAGTNADTCCYDKRGVFLLDGAAVVQNPIGFASSSLSRTSSAYSSSSIAPLTSSSSLTGLSSLSTSAIATTLGGPSSTSASSSAPEPSTRVGVIVGGTIGGLIILSLMLTTGTCLIRRRRKHQNFKIHETSLSHGETWEGFEAPGCNEGNELDAIRPPRELADARMRQELQ